MSPRLMQHPSLGKQFRKHMFSMQGHFIIWRERRSGDAAKELSLSFATCRELGAPEGTASAAQAGSASLAANVTFQAKESLLRCTNQCDAPQARSHHNSSSKHGAQSPWSHRWSPSEPALGPTSLEQRVLGICVLKPPVVLT